MQIILKKMCIRDRGEGVGYPSTDTGELDVDRDFRSRGSALLQKMDFFNLYGLPEYIPSQDNRTDNYLGFMPIIIRNASFYGDEVGERTTIDSDICLLYTSIVVLSMIEI